MTDRDLVERPYSADEERVVEYIVNVTGIGGGDDPVGFLIASHAALAERLRQPTPCGCTYAPDELKR